MFVLDVGQFRHLLQFFTVQLLIKLLRTKTVAFVCTQGDHIAEKAGRRKWIMESENIPIFQLDFCILNSNRSLRFCMLSLHKVLRNGRLCCCVAWPVMGAVKAVVITCSLCYQSQSANASEYYTYCGSIH